MAKNIKGRKFVATAATAALVASAIVPVASAAVEFSDAGQISDYAKDAVNYLVGEEIINGLGDGSFGPKGEITRAQAATIFTKALKLDTTGTENFSDVNADDWFFSAVVGVANAGIVNGMGDGTFAPDNKLTRAQAAKMIVEAYKLTGKADLAKYTDAADLQTWAADALAIAVKNGIMKGNSDTTLNPEGNITREDFAVMVKRAIDATEKETETKEIAVTSVSAINLTQIVVSFNEKLDKTTAETKSNYTFDGAALAASDVVTLAEDGKNVVITLAAPIANQSTKKVTVKNVKSEAGSTVEDFSAEVTFSDFQAPVVESVVSAGPDSFKVTFSEPVDLTTAQTPGNYTLNDGQYFIQSATRTALNEVTVKVYSTLPEGTYTVGVKNVQDLANFKVADTKKSYTQVADTTAPTVATVVSASPEKVVLEFSEDISLNDTEANLIANTKIYHTNTTNKPSGIAIDPTNSKRLILTFTNKLPQGGTAYLVIEKDVVKDGWNNKNAQYTANIPVTVDTVKPTVTKLESPTDKSFKLTFSEEVTSATAQTVANYTILDGEGKKVTTAISSAVLSGTGNNVVTLTLASALSGGNYTVVVENVKDLAGNTIDKTSNVATVKDTTAPTVKSAGLLYADKKIVKVEFTEAMATTGTGSVLDLSNYQFGGTYLNTTKAAVSVTDNGKAVLIDYSKTDLTIVSGNEIVVGKVADATGNTTSNFTTTVTLSNPTTVGIDAVEATGTKTVVVTLDDSLSKFNATDFVIKQGGTAITPASVTFANVDGVGVITYTLTDAQKLNTAGKLASNGTSVVTVETAAATSSENAFGVKVATSAPAVNADDKIVASVNKYDHDLNSATADVDQVEVSYTDADFDGKIDKTETAIFTVHYSEDLDPTTISKLGFEVAGFTVTAVALDTDNSIVKITASATADNTAITTTVKQVANIADANGNVIVGGTSYTVAKEATASASANLSAQQQAAVDAVAAGIAATLTATAAVNTVVLPTVPTGYTIAVNTSSDSAVYGTDGKVLTSGTSNVVYTITNTASGKTADTATVAVTVTVTP